MKKYYAICHTYNNVGDSLQLRNSWVDTKYNKVEITELLDTYGLCYPKIGSNGHSGPIMAPFTINDTTIIITIIET